LIGADSQIKLFLPYEGNHDAADRTAIPLRIHGLAASNQPQAIAAKSHHLRENIVNRGG